ALKFEFESQWQTIVGRHLAPVQWPPVVGLPVDEGNVDQHDIDAAQLTEAGEYGDDVLGRLHPEVGQLVQPVDVDWDVEPDKGGQQQTPQRIAFDDVATHQVMLRHHVPHQFRLSPGGSHRLQLVRQTVDTVQSGDVDREHDERETQFEERVF